ncbi:MAG: hypothetical protein PHO08_04145 [Methylococcales bacterium]|nr:hypothetical protein [Methylococcales bacterium]MDD5630476.1 hypothetical protein [Methylococcales bacterium]
MTGEVGMCQRWLENIEATLEEHNLNDPGTALINGFPHLRVNRLLASMGDRTTSNGAFSEWLEEMRQLDATGKKLEFANLPASAMLQLLSKIPLGGSFEQALELCGKRLNKLSLYNPEQKENLLEQAQVPDAYQSWKRVAGLYLLTRYAASAGIERLHRELDASFNIPPAKLPRQGQLIRYSPPYSNPLPLKDIAAMLKPAYDNPLGIPHLISSQLQQLLAHFAPIWEIDTRNDTDKIGSVGLDSDKQPLINVSQPTVYVAHEYARWHGRVVLQLIYQIWLPAREKTGMLDLYGGPLDSVIWRVTLSPEGTPIAFDSIHACGCYYLLFPSQGYRAIKPKDDTEPVLSPKSIATIPPGYRLLLRLQTRTHYLQQTSLSGDTFETATRSYIFHELEQLRSLQMPNGTKRSLYGDDGIIDASERAERFLLWPYGVASPGAMRQWGTHAIAFIGRRHFDDPFLLEHLVDKK